jgi:hypothetical protein
LIVVYTHITQYLGMNMCRCGFSVGMEMRLLNELRWWKESIDRVTVVEMNGHSELIRGKDGIDQQRFVLQGMKGRGYGGN